MRKMKAIENGSLPDINPNLGELFRGSFCDGVRWGVDVGIKLPCLKLVKIILET